MQHFEPSVFMEDVEKGIARVKRDKPAFAFFMESVSIEYYIRKDCDLTKIGEKLDEKEYGIAMPMSIFFFCANFNRYFNCFFYFSFFL